MPQNARKKDQLPKSVLNTRQENELINSKLAHLKVKGSDPPYLRTVTVQTKGLFKCDNCNKIWSSHRSFVQVDIVNFCLLDTVNRQGCINCKSLYHDITLWPTPCFKECWFEKILEKVVTKYNMRKASNGQRLSDGNGIQIANNSQGPAHCRDLCEKCIKFKTPCWQSI